MYVCIHVSKYEVLLLPGAPKVCFFPGVKMFWGIPNGEIQIFISKEFWFCERPGYMRTNVEHTGAVIAADPTSKLRV